MNIPPLRTAPLRASRLYSTAVESSKRAPRLCYLSKWHQSRGLATVPSSLEAIPLRKRLKEQAKVKKAEAKSAGNVSGTKQDLDSRLEKWELTVGIEIHAQLNTATKLFSSAPSSLEESNGSPNSNVALFDAAMPGSQPRFQVATLLPAIRAALALDCTIQKESGWDRKHYFHWDQPNGYQITQYYQPFAKNGRIELKAEDGVPAIDLAGAPSLSIGIKQVQMEQDTAKTTHHPPHTYHIDLNRAGQPLIEIITLPQIHSPQAAAAVVKKIQAVLKSVGACVIGMESGGLRADVNVSIRERGRDGALSYSGVHGLGQRTEIKNLSSFKAVEDAIVAERDRQISVLESGGTIEGETRGWTLGASETTRLRSKEGEVDYRYMPDADLPPLFIGQDLIDSLTSTLPELPNETVERVQRAYGLTQTDARTIVGLDDGDRLEFLEEAVHLLQSTLSEDQQDGRKLGKMVGNWVLHELGGMLTSTGSSWADLTITPTDLADILSNLMRHQITARVAKQLLITVSELDATSGPRFTVDQLIDGGNLRSKPLGENEYESLARQIMEANPDIVSAVRDKGQKGKIMWFVGQMIRQGQDGAVDPDKARQIIVRLLSTWQGEV